MNRDCIDAIFKYFEVSESFLTQDQADCVMNLKSSFQVAGSLDQAVDLEQALEFYSQRYRRWELDQVRKSSLNKLFPRNGPLQEMAYTAFPFGPAQSSLEEIHPQPKKVYSESSSSSSNDLPSHLVASRSSNPHERTLDFHISRGYPKRGESDQSFIGSTRSQHDMRLQSHGTVVRDFPLRPVKSSPSGQTHRPKKVDSESSSTSSNDILPPAHVARPLSDRVLKFNAGYSDPRRERGMKKSPPMGFPTNGPRHEIAVLRPLQSSPTASGETQRSVPKKAVHSESCSTSSNDFLPPDQFAPKKQPSPPSQSSQSLPPPPTKEERPDIVEVTEARRTVEGRTVCVLRVDPRKDSEIGLFREFACFGPITALCFFSIENHARRKRAQRTLFLPRMTNHRGWAQWIKKTLERKFPNLTSVRHDMRENVFVEFRERSDAQTAITKIADMTFKGERLAPEMALDEFEPEQLGLVEFKTRADARKAVAKFERHPSPRWKVELARTNFEITVGTKVLRTQKQDRRKIILTQPKQHYSGRVASSIAVSSPKSVNPSLSYAARVSRAKKKQFIKSEAAAQVTNTGSQRLQSKPQRSMTWTSGQSQFQIPTTTPLAETNSETQCSANQVSDLMPHSQELMRSSRPQQQQLQSKLNIPREQEACFRPKPRPHDEVLKTHNLDHHGASLSGSVNDVDEFLLAVTSVQHRDPQVEQSLDLEFDELLDPSALLPTGLLGPAAGHRLVPTQMEQPGNSAILMTQTSGQQDAVTANEPQRSRCSPVFRQAQHPLFAKDQVIIAGGTHGSNPSISLPYVNQTPSWEHAPVQQLYYR